MRRGPAPNHLYRVQQNYALRIGLRFLCYLLFTPSEYPPYCPAASNFDQITVPAGNTAPLVTTNTPSRMITAPSA
jgi:hypothetical protein